MENHLIGTELKLSGHWDLSGVVHQIDSLSILHQMEIGKEKLCRIDCSEICSFDMSGLQLLYAWMQCVCIRGIKPELFNLPENMKLSIKRLGFDKCFSKFCADGFPSGYSEFSNRRQ
jgi:ABC-type transporter Mla MlaB component